MQIKIVPHECGGTEFLAQPHRLHLGAQEAAGVDRLTFVLPASWQSLAVTVHIRHSDGTLAEPLALDSENSVSVGHSFTGWSSGQWMLAATNGTDYTAYTRPGSYDVHGILPTDGTEEEPAPSVYEQFVARVIQSANAAGTAAQNAAASEANAKAYLREAKSAASQSAANSDLATSCATRAESAAARAESLAPVDGTVLSVNGKGGAVKLAAADVGAVPQPVAPAAGALLRVLKVDTDTGALTTDTVTPGDIGALGSTEKTLILKLFENAVYTGTDSQASYTALKELWTGSGNLPTDIPVESVTLSASTLALTTGQTRTLTASVLPSNATDSTVSWTVTGTAATISASGKSCTVTAAAAGSATVTATAGGKSATCAVTVTAAQTGEITLDTVNDGVTRNWLTTTPLMKDFFVPLTVKKSVTLKQLRFQLDATATASVSITLASLGSDGVSVASTVSVTSGTNDISLDYDVALTAGTEYQLQLATDSQVLCYPYLPDESVRENDYISVNGTSYKYNNTKIRYIGYITIEEGN